MLTEDLLRTARRIEVRTRRLVDETFAGRYLSTFRGQGIEFSEVRPYQSGDDVRTIDWNVTARTGSPHVKRYVEERELTVLVAVDASGSGDIGTAGRLKRELSTEFAAVISFAATTASDRVGLAMFTDRIELFVPPRKGRKHVMRLVAEMLSFRPASPGTDLGGSIATLSALLRRRGVVFVISDFLAPATGYERELSAASLRHDLVAVEVRDRLHDAVPAVGLVTLRDAETGETRLVDTSDPAWRGEMAARAEAHRAERAAALASASVDRMVIETGKDYVPELMRFFEGRVRRAGRGRRRPRGAARAG